MDLYWSLVELGAQHRLHSKLCVSFATPCMNHWLQAALSSPLRLCREGENRVRCLSWGGFGASGTAWDGLPLSSEVREPFSMDGLTGVKRLRAGCAEGRSQAEVPFPHRCGWQGDREVADLGVSISQLLPPTSPSTAVWRKGQALPALRSFPGLTASIGDLLSPSSSQVCLPILRTPFLPTLPAPRAQAGQPHALGM